MQQPRLGSVTQRGSVFGGGELAPRPCYCLNPQTPRWARGQSFSTQAQDDLSLLVQADPGGTRITIPPWSRARKATQGYWQHQRGGEVVYLFLNIILRTPPRPLACKQLVC